MCPSIAFPLPLPMAWHSSLCSYGRVRHKLCCTFFSCSLLHCLPKFLATAQGIHSRPGVALRTATDLMKTWWFPALFCTFWLSAFFASSPPVLSFMTLSCVRVFVDGLAHLMWFLLQGLSQTVLHTFLTLDAQLHSITLSSPYVSTNRRPKAQKRGAAVDRRRRLQSAAPSLKLGSRAS